MQQYFNNVTDSQGNAVQANVQVNVLGGAIATLYSDNGVTPLVNPFATDSKGMFAFYAADGHYTITISGVTVATAVLTDVLLEDQANPSPAAFTTVSLSGQLTSTQVTGTAPLVIASTTPVLNLVVDSAVPRTSSVASAVLPSGTTANRDGTPVLGYVRYNTSLSQFEGYGSTGWGKIGGGTSGGGTDAAFYAADSYIKTSFVLGSEAMISGATVTIAAPAVVNMVGHNFEVNSQVMFETTGALPTGLAVDTRYFVTVVVDVNNFRLSATQGGADITTSGTQSGVHSCGKFKNTFSPGPQTIGGSATVTIPSGSTWTVVA